MNPLTPVVHLNGTSGKVLLAGWVNLLDALDESMRKALELELNARDYYPRSPDAFRVALENFKQHAAALRAFRDAAEQVADELDRVITEQNERKAGR